MKIKWIAAGAAAVMLTTLAYQCSWSSSPELDSSRGVPPATTLVAGIESEELEPPPRDARQRVPGKAQRAAAEVIRFRGRCVDAVTGAPVAGCRVDVRGLRFDGREQAGFAPPTSVVSDASGSFKIHSGSTADRLELLVRGRDAVEMSAWWDRLSLGADLNVGDVAIERGCAVRGHVVDTAGTPQGGVVVSFIYDVKGYTLNKRTIAPTGQQLATSDSAGAFTIRLPAGKWTWFVEAPHRRKIEIPPPTLEIQSGQIDLSFEVEILRVIASIRGIVVDASGTALEGAIVEVKAPRLASLSNLEVRTDAVGAFLVPRLEDWPDPPVMITVKRTGFEPAKTKAPVPWGTDNLRFALHRLRTSPLVFVVIDAETNRPIEEFAVRIAPEPSSSRGFSLDDYRAWRPRLAGHHAEGRLTVLVTHGRHLVTVEPADENWAAPMPQTVAVSDAVRPPIRFVIHPNASRRVQIEDGAGKPVAGAQVQLLKSVGRGVNRGTSTGSMAKLPQLLVRGRGALEYYRGTTDEHGAVTVIGPPGDYVLRLPGPGHVPLIVPEFALAKGAVTMKIVVDRGAEVVGRVGPAASLARIWPRGSLAKSAESTPNFLPKVRLFDLDKRRYYPPGRGRIDVTEDGRFEVDAVPPGNYAVRFVYTYLVMGVVCRSTAELGTIQGLAAGERRDVAFDIRAIVPGKLRGEVMMDGKPLAEAMIRLLNVREGRQVLVASAIYVSTDRDGRFAIAVPPGRYLASIKTDFGTKKRTLYGGATVLVPDGSEVDHTFRLFRTRLRVRVKTADGQAVAGREFFVSGPRCWRSAGPTDDRGVIVLDPAPVLGPFDLVTWPDEYRSLDQRRAFQRANRDTWKEGLIRLGPIECPIGAKEHAVELTMPGR